MLSSLKVTKNTCMFITFMGSTSRAGICMACLKLTTLGRRIVNRFYHFCLMQADEIITVSLIFKREFGIGLLYLEN